MRRFSQSLPMMLLRARETAIARFRPILHEHGLTEQQWRVLRALEDLGEMTAVGLATECSMLAPSITRILRKLGEQGLVATTRSKSDRRALRVRISRDGKRLVAQLGPKIEREYLWIRDRLRPEHLSALYYNLQRLIDLGKPKTDA